jgi:hypothetical protein
LLEHVPVLVDASSEAPCVLKCEHCADKHRKRHPNPDGDDTERYGGNDRDTANVPLALAVGRAVHERNERMPGIEGQDRQKIHKTPPQVEKAKERKVLSHIAPGRLVLRDRDGDRAEAETCYGPPQRRNDPLGRGERT